jgi:hypothetical protein
MVLLFVATNTIGDFYTQLNTTAPGRNPTRDNLLNESIEGARYISDYIKLNSAQISKIEYSNWKLAQQTNYFLDIRSPFIQMVSSETGSEPGILIYGKNGKQKFFSLTK